MPNSPTDPEAAPSLTLLPTMLMSDLEHSMLLSEDDLPCLGEDPDLFFTESPRGVEQAKQVCADCPVRQQCLQGALERAEPWGVWGGELFQAGAVIAFKRGRGRPPKINVA